jgi:uncharacterized protein YbjT (DUF2867 family)
VEDIAEAVVSAVVDDRAASRVHNVSEPDALSEADWVRAIGRVAGWRGEVISVPGDRLSPSNRESDRQRFPPLPAHFPS